MQAYKIVVAVGVVEGGREIAHFGLYDLGTVDRKFRRAATIQSFCPRPSQPDGRINEPTRGLE
jgi:hypothetical protein